MSETIRERYAKGFITAAQLARYAALGVVSEAEAAELTGGTPETDMERPWGGAPTPAGD